MEYDRSYGCVIIENNKILLIKHQKGHWGFPKGHMEKDETPMQTAIREVKEETNIDVEILSKKEYTEIYTTQEGVNRKVVFFIAKKIGGKLKPQESEVEIVKWFNFEEAMQTLTYEEAKQTLKEVIKDL